MASDMLGMPASLGRKTGPGTRGFPSRIGRIALFPFNGSPGQGVTYDAIGTHAITLSNATISAVQSKFGSASLRSELTPGSASIAEHKDFVSTKDDFTWQWWIFRTGTMFTYLSDSLTTNFLIEDPGNGNITLKVFFNGAVWAINTTVGGVTANAWHHMAYTRFNNLHTVWADGASAISGTYTGSQEANGTSGYVANQPNSGVSYMQDLCYSNFCEYTAAFEPPTRSLLLKNLPLR